MNRLLRGIGGIVGAEGLYEGSSGGKISALAKLLPDHEESAREVWIRQIELENPGR
jgi:hypothetical protein